MSKAAELAALIGSGQAQGDRNLIINGAMKVAQRGTSSTGLGASSGYFTVDRFRMNFNTSGRLTMTQEAITDLEGFANAIKLVCTTADTSIASGENLFIQHRLEGQDLQQLEKGTSGAKPITLSFYVKGNAAATYTAEIRDQDNTRFNGQEFSVTTSWNRVSLTYVGDTTGAYDDDNENSLTLGFILHAGSAYTGGTFASNTWQTTTDKRVGDNQTSFFDSTDRTFFITGLQMEIGETATPFEHEDFGTTLAKCQRYYTIEKAGTGGVYKRLALGQCQDSTSAGFILSLSTPLRGTPTLETSGNSNHYQTYSAGAVDTLTGILLTSDSDAGTYNHNIAFNVTVSSGLVAGDGTELVTNNNASYYLAFDAEL